MIVILGPTASGKTTFAANLAIHLNGEIISADSRQVYRGMTIGTGKDLDDYTIGEFHVPFHLIDIVDPGYEYNVFEFLWDFNNSFTDISSRGKTPILCGGSGLYIDAVVNGYRMNKVKDDPEQVKVLESKTDDELREILEATRSLHNTTDLIDRKRMIKAIRVASHNTAGEQQTVFEPVAHPLLIGIQFEREKIRERITERLKRRLETGMISEVETLLARGLSPDQLKFYGLEYRYITLYLEGMLSYDDMFRLLNTAIHQFAKRQMTWFRKMEREGHLIHWIDGTLNEDEKIRLTTQFLTADNST